MDTTDQTMRIVFDGFERVFKITGQIALKTLTFLNFAVKGIYGKATQKSAKEILSRSSCPTPIALNKEDFEIFKSEAKKFGVTFVSYREAENEYTVIIRGEDSAVYNRIAEKNGLVTLNADEYLKRTEEAKTDDVKEVENKGLEEEAEKAKQDELNKAIDGLLDEVDKSEEAEVNEVGQLTGFEENQNIDFEKADELPISEAEQGMLFDDFVSECESKTEPTAEKATNAMEKALNPQSALTAESVEQSKPELTTQAKEAEVNEVGQLTGFSETEKQLFNEFDLPKPNSKDVSSNLDVAEKVTDSTKKIVKVNDGKQTVDKAIETATKAYEKQKETTKDIAKAVAKGVTK